MEEAVKLIREERGQEVEKRGANRLADRPASGRCVLNTWSRRPMRRSSM